MGKRILLGCYEVPGYGGASTAGYKLFEMMQNDGFDVCYLSVIGEKDAGRFRQMFGENFANPRSLDNVHHCVLDGPWSGPQRELDALINGLSPDVLVGIGYIAALLLKRAAPEKRLMFLTTGCEQAKSYAAKRGDVTSLNEFIRGVGGPPVLFHRLEKEAVETSDLILTHSDMIRSLYRYFFPHQSEKICPDVIWFAEWIYKDALDYCGLQQPFSGRDVDVIFVASSWGRPEKNYGLVKEIVLGCKGLNVHVVGEAEEKLSPAEYHGLVTRREELFALLGRSKAVVCPSLFDAAPGVLFEASAMGCNVVTSKNCGNWQLCNEKLLVDPFSLDNFLEKISLSLSKKYEDNIDYFMRTNSYDNLMDMVSAF